MAYRDALDERRQRYQKRVLAYFAREGHEIVPSSPLVPRNDPTLMFTNAGMVQFKNVFTGLEKRPYVRAQPRRRNACARAASTTTSTMSATPRVTTPSLRCSATSRLATTSRNAPSSWAWNLVTKEFGVPGREAAESPSTSTTMKPSGLEEDRGPAKRAGYCVSLAEKFWAMGDTGPCGRCSEIFYDHASHIPGGPPGSPRGPKVTASSRFWNLGVHAVRAACRSGKRLDLPRPSIETRLGLERMAAVLQGTHGQTTRSICSAR